MYPHMRFCGVIYSAEENIIEVGLAQIPTLVVSRNLVPLLQYNLGALHYCFRT